MRLHTGVYGRRKRVCTESGLWEKNGTWESHLRQRRAGPTLYQLSYIPTKPPARSFRRVILHWTSKKKKSHCIPAVTVVKVFVLFCFFLIAWAAISHRLETSFAYSGQLHTRLNRRPPDHELVLVYKDSLCTGFSACTTGMNRMKVASFM